MIRNDKEYRHSKEQLSELEEELKKLSPVHRSAERNQVSSAVVGCSQPSQFLGRGKWSWLTERVEAVGVVTQRGLNNVRVIQLSLRFNSVVGMECAKSSAGA